MSSTDVFPYQVWLSGTNENSVPANDNSLRTEVLTRSATDFADAEPVDPEERAMFVVGTPWGDFASDDVVIYIEGTWYGFSPFVGWTKLIEGQLYSYVGESEGWEIFGGTGTGIVQSIVAGDGVTVDDTDPENPIVSATGTGAGSALIGSLALKVSGAQYYLQDFGTAAAPSGGTFSADTVRYVPFVVDRERTVTSIGVNVSTTAASQKARVGIYENKTSGGIDEPGNLLVSSGDLNIGSSGVQSSSVSITLQPGTVYWAAILNSASFGCIAAQITSGRPLLGRLGAANHNAITYLSSTVAPGWSALPAAGSGTYSSNSAVVPLVTAAF
jgi:hypothetical protein